MACADPRATDVCNVFPRGRFWDVATAEATCFLPFIFFDVSNSLRRRRKNWVGSAAKAFGPLLQLY